MTSKKQIAGLLADVPLFTRCTGRALTTIARHCELHDFDEGTDLVVEGAAGDAFFVLVSGSCNVSRNAKVVATIGPGGFFGELALLDPAPRSATISTTEPTTVAVLGPRMFRTLMREYPDMTEGLLSGLAAQLREERSS